MNFYPKETDYRIGYTLWSEFLFRTIPFSNTEAIR